MNCVVTVRIAADAQFQIGELVTNLLLKQLTSLVIFGSQPLRKDLATGNNC